MGERALLPEPLVVLELASVLAGPSVGQFFAELGATVIKLENPRTGGDVTRRWHLPSEDVVDDRPAYFCACNSGKHAAAIDLGHPGGRALLHRLAARADVVLASYRPGQASALCADAATLRALNPRMVYGAISGYGPDNPRPGYDAVIQAESGFMSMNGLPDGEPLKMPVALIDVLAAHQLKQALLLALWRRSITGQGSTHSVSLMDAALSALANQATNYLNAGKVAERMGSAHPNIAPYGSTHVCLGGERLMLAVGTDAQFLALCHVLGTSWSEDDAFRTNADRVRHRERLDRLLAERLRTAERSELLDALHRAGVPAGAVQSIDEALSQTQAQALLLRHQERTGLRQAVFATDLTPAPPPRFAEHTAHVLQQYADCTPADLERLHASGVITLPSN